MLSLWGSMKKKPLCSVPAAHGNSVENNQPNWISSVAALTNTDLVASGKKPFIIFKLAVALLHGKCFMQSRVARWIYPIMEMWTKLSLLNVRYDHTGLRFH